MYQWYQQAAICYVFLSDLNIDINATSANIEMKLPECKWFTHDWCLPGLIAPLVVEFFDAHWH